jgi:hypothetical protein
MLNGSVGDRLPQLRDTIGTPYRIGREMPELRERPAAADTKRRNDLAAAPLYR